MSNNYLDAPGGVISKCDLKISKAQEVVTAIEKLPYFALRELRRLSNGTEAEVVVFDAEIEVGQVTIHDIRCSERIAIIFSAKDDSFPEVLALREDFPKVPHLILRDQEKPRSLCLFNEKYNEFKFRWTSTLFLERIREWLSLTAKGELHANDQPLEPLLMGSPIHLIIPFDLFSQESSCNANLLMIRRTNYGENTLAFIAERIENAPPEKNEFKYIATAIQCAPQVHGIINRQPSNLYELHKFLLEAGVDLLSVLRKRLREFKDNEKYNLLKANLVLIVELPKTRKVGESPEDTDVWAFVVFNSIEEIGIEIGIWTIFNGKLSLLLQHDLSKEGKTITIHLLNPVNSLSRELASQINGFPQIEKKKIVLVGGGALGSQVFMNLVRMGFGE